MVTFDALHTVRANWPVEHSRQTIYTITSLTSAHSTSLDLARLARERWSIEAHHHAT